MANLEYFLNIKQDNILTFKKFRYLKLSAVTMAICVALYVFDRPSIKANGGAVLGYGLGTLGAVLIVWLLAYGVRKRSYRSTAGTVLGWLSAHIYLGIALAVVVTLHTGFEFGWNVHTLAYALMILVILSGFWGVFLYIRQPTLMGNILNGKALQQYGNALRDIDQQCAALTKDMSPDIRSVVAASANGSIFSSRWQRFSGKNPRCETRKALNNIERTILPKMYRRSSRTLKIPVAFERRRVDIQPRLREIYTLQFRRLQQLNRIREFVQLKSWTEIWLIFHVPLSFALLAALIAHIVSIFFYW
jgi:hypothetical protein